MGTLKKSKGTLISPNLKVGENKVPLVFLFPVYGQRYGQFLISKRKRSYPGSWALLEKIKGTLI